MVKKHKSTRVKYAKGLEATLKTMGTRIATARKIQFLTQTDMHKKTGINYRHYQNIEAGAGNITISTLSRIATVLKININQLLP